jgi:signal transduction histidine kinase/HPt (histidine-containing phosphotransfer) domain-containing protein
MSKRILVIDDSRTEALKARLFLEREGYQVALAVDGHDGLFKAAQEKPDLILLDTVMPNMNGFEACGKLKIDPQTQHIPIMLMPTEAEAADMPSGAGLAAFLIKPYDPKALVAKVGALLDHGAVLSQPAELQQLRRQLDAAQTARSDFLANMSHELRTPLHEIMGMTDLLIGTDLNGEQLSYLNTAKASSNALLSLISDVIEFSELEAGQLGLQNKEFDLAEPLERVVEMMGTRASEKGLKLSTAVSHQVPHALNGDATRLRQVLSNLVANAIKFTEQGEVNVRVDREAARDPDVELHFRVSDTGIGIPAGRLELIFEPFQQADTSATRRYGGLGMGLALAKQLVKLMGGQIWAESRAGEGSTFHFTVKMTTPATQATQPAAAARNWPRALNILLAEDSPTNQLIAQSSLKKVGHTVTLAVNGLEAVKAFEQSHAGHTPFDLVLMDISMPEMDGLEATNIIRAQEQTLGGHIIIVAMTAFATQEYHEKCFAAGMDGYVTKPVRIEELNRALEPLMADTGDQGTGNRDQGSQVKDQAIDLREALEVVGDDVDIMREAVALSLAEIPGELNALRAAMEQSDVKGVEAKAHRLKGLMGNLGGRLARDAGQQLETMGEQGNLAGGPAALKQFEQEIGDVVTFYSDPKWERLALEVAGGA